MRKYIAYLFCPFIPTTYFLAIPFFTSMTGADVAINSSYIYLVLLFSLPVSYLSCAVIGLPYLMYLRRRDEFYAVKIISGSAVAGAVIFYLFGFVFAALLNSSRPLLPSVAELGFGAFFGLSISIPFCMILRVPLIKPKVSNDS